MVKIKVLKTRSIPDELLRSYNFMFGDSEHTLDAHYFWCTSADQKLSMSYVKPNPDNKFQIFICHGFRFKYGLILAFNCAV